MLRSTAVRRAILAAAVFLINALSPAVAVAEIEPSAESIKQGAEIFRLYCTSCHGDDGKAQIDVISDATDLTDPGAYYSGTERIDIFNSIKFGAGVSMPPWTMGKRDDNDIWHLVNFIQSLQMEPDNE